jgi:hypothetical protein
MNEPSSVNIDFDDESVAISMIEGMNIKSIDNLNHPLDSSSKLKYDESESDLEMEEFKATPYESKSKQDLEKQEN